jgi:ferredoxin, 2Fe-2S
MARIVFEEPGGNDHAVDIPNGQSIMEGAVRNSVVGIDADCGGACSCATCMVYVAQEWRDRLPPKASDEQAMLEFCPHVEESSRLSCQIKVSDALDGLRLKVPASQH